VDASRLAAYGISGGGYAVTRAAATDGRIRAAIATTPIYDIYRLITQAIPAFLLDESHSGVSRWLLEISGRYNKAGKNNMDKFAWQSGKGSLLEAVRVTEGRPVDVGAIECPMLCLAAEGDPPEALEQTKYVFDHLEHPNKAMRILTAEEGCRGAHPRQQLPALAPGSLRLARRAVHAKGHDPKTEVGGRNMTLGPLVRQRHGASRRTLPQNG
jgi:hypothetical protein